MSSESNKSSESIPADAPRDESAPAEAAADREHATGADAHRPDPADAAESTAESSETKPAETKPARPAARRRSAAADEEEEVQPIESLIEEEPEEGEPEFHWYILKVQVNREDSIRDALIRRVKIEGLEEMFREIVVPTEDVAEFNKAGKRRIVKKKLYPGYIMVNMAINDDTWFLVRETPGIGDFTGSAGKPTPVEQSEVDKILSRGKTEEGDEAHVKTSIPFSPGDQVRVKDGNFQGFEGDVDAIDEAHGRVTVMINIFGRPTPVELEHWQIEAV